MISGYLLNYDVKDDIGYLANLLDFDIPSYNKKDILSDEKVALINITKAKFIYDSKTKLYNEMVNEDVTLFENIEMPLAKVLLIWKFKVLE